MHEAKLTPRAIKHLDRHNNEDSSLLKLMTVAIAGNSGWAGLLPAAVVAKAIDTTIEFYNQLADLEIEIESQRSQLSLTFNK